MELPAKEVVKKDQWKIDAEAMRNPGLAKNMPEFVNAYFPKLIVANKLADDDKPKVLAAYATYLQTIIKATGYDTNAKFYGSVKAYFQTYEMLLDSGQHKEASQQLAYAFQAIKGQGQEEVGISLEVDGHMWKHYSGGESGACQFTKLTWEETHKLQICAMRKLNLQPGGAFPLYVLVTVTDMTSVGTGGSSAPGDTNLVKIEVGRQGRDRIEFHGYPIGASQYTQAKSKGYPELTVTAAEFRAVVLTPPNDDKRLK